MIVHSSLSTDGSHLRRSVLNSFCIRRVPECIPRAVRTGTCAKLQRLRSTRLPQGVRNCTNSTLVNSIFTGHLLRLDSTLYVLIISTSYDSSRSESTTGNQLCARAKTDVNGNEILADDVDNRMLRPVPSLQVIPSMPR